MKSDDLVEVLIGSELAWVVFVRDYLQLRFEGLRAFSTLSIYTEPWIQLCERVSSWGEPGFRDALCERINQEVHTADITAARNTHRVCGWRYA